MFFGLDEKFNHTKMFEAVNEQTELPNEICTLFRRKLNDIKYEYTKNNGSFVLDEREVLIL